MMRRELWLVGLIVAPLTLGGCGGSDEGAKPTTTTVKATASTTLAPEDEDLAYELDVIAEAEPDEGAPPLKVQFTASVEEEEGGPWKFAWDFGDGSKSSDQNPEHTYANVGEYTATLVVTDSRGNRGTDEIDIFVETEEQME